ncbi:hypothetical protein ACLMJK_001079 [Lecanora helva]
MAAMRQIILLGTIGVLGNLADIIHKRSRVYLFQQALCLVYYKVTDPSKLGLDYNINESDCKIKQVQSRLSIYEGLDSFLFYLPLWLHRDWAAPAALLTSGFDLIGGGALVRLTLINKCIADISPPDKL